MRISEVMGKTRKVIDVQPDSVQRQSRIKGVMNQLAINDQQPQAPSEDEKIIAMFKYNALKKQQEQNYANKLRQQLDAIEQKNEPKPPGIDGRTRR